MQLLLCHHTPVNGRPGLRACRPLQSVGWRCIAHNTPGIRVSRPKDSLFLLGSFIPAVSFLPDVEPLRYSTLTATWSFTPESLLCSKNHSSATVSLQGASVVAGDHAASQPPKHMAGGVYGRHRAPKTGGDGAVLAPLAQPQEADRRWVLTHWGASCLRSREALSEARDVCSSFLRSGSLGGPQILQEGDLHNPFEGPMDYQSCARTGNTKLPLKLLHKHAQNCPWMSSSVKRKRWLPLRLSCWHDSISAPAESGRGTELQVDGCCGCRPA